MGVGQGQVLGDELELDHAAAGMLQLPGAVLAVLAEDPLAHGADGSGQRPRLARARDAGIDDPVDLAVERRVARHHARAGERLLLPDLGGLGLVALEGVERAGDGPEIAGRA